MVIIHFQRKLPVSGPVTTTPPVSIEKETMPDTKACLKLLSKLKEQKKTPEGQVHPQWSVVALQRPLSQSANQHGSLLAGHFKVVQCDKTSGVCWCVDPEDGEEIPGTRLQKSKGQPKCGACLHAKAKMLDDLTKGKTGYMVECDISGNFQPIQCNAEEGYCWCVHTDSGEVVYGTRTKTDKGQPDCTAEEFDSHRYFYFENVGCSETIEKSLAKCYKTFRQSFPKIAATASPLSIYSLIYNMMYNGQYKQGCEHYGTYSKCASMVLKDKKCFHYGNVITTTAFSYICQPTNQKFFIEHTKCLRKWIKHDAFGKCKAQYHAILTKLLCVKSDFVKTCDLKMWNMVEIIMDNVEITKRHTLVPGAKTVKPVVHELTTPKHIPGKTVKPTIQEGTKKPTVEITTVKPVVPGKKPEVTTPKAVPSITSVVPGKKPEVTTVKVVPGKTLKPAVPVKKPEVTTPKPVPGKVTIKKPAVEVTTPKHVPSKTVHPVVPGKKPEITTPKPVPGKVTIKKPAVEVTTPKHVPSKTVHPVVPGKKPEITTPKPAPGKVTVKKPAVEVTTPKHVPSKTVHPVVPGKKPEATTQKHVPGKEIPKITVKVPAVEATTTKHVPGKTVKPAVPGKKPEVTTLKSVPGKISTRKPALEATTPKRVPSETSMPMVLEQKPEITTRKAIPDKTVKPVVPEKKPQVTTPKHVPGMTVKKPAVEATTPKHVPGKTVKTVVPGKKPHVTTVKPIPGKVTVKLPKVEVTTKHVPGTTVKPVVIPGKKPEVTTPKHIPSVTVKKPVVKATTPSHLPGRTTKAVIPGKKPEVTTPKVVPGKKPQVSTPKHVTVMTVKPAVPEKKPTIKPTTPKHVKEVTTKHVEKVVTPVVTVQNKTVVKVEGVTKVAKVVTAKPVVTTVKAATVKPGKEVKVTHVSGATKVVPKVTKKPVKVEVSTVSSKAVPTKPSKVPVTVFPGKITVKPAPAVTPKKVVEKTTAKPGRVTPKHVTVKGTTPKAPTAKVPVAVTKKPVVTPKVTVKVPAKPAITTATAKPKIGVTMTTKPIVTMAVPTMIFAIDRVAQIKPDKVECSPVVEHWKQCLSTFIKATNFLSGSLTDLTLISSRWSNIFDICQHYYNYDACMSMCPDVETSECVPFGHTALSGYVGNVCNREVMQAMKKHGSCITRYLANETDLSDCVQTFVDFFNLSYTSLKPQRTACQKIGGIHGCIQRFLVDRCHPDAQRTLAKVKLGCYHASSQLCDNITLVGDKTVTREVVPSIVVSWSGECAKKQADALKSGHVGDFVPRCEENGDYSLVQCDKNECWCVDIKTGEEAPNTRKAGGASDVRCGRCHLEQAKAAKEHKKAIPSCQNNGRYHPLQCDYSIGQCWCVDTQDGTEINNTRVGKNQKLPNCGLKNEFSCRPLPKKSKCMPDGSKPSEALRWFKDGQKCRVYKVSFCPNEAHLPPFAFRYQSDCEEMCLGPYANRLPVRL
ncbi:unnamed protein product [Soboliphyme baturini]|uniref:Thyroglobulin type-1 domain-containing protein n=1 Tax=Soboliphyme baturini TaxID=241478 RepID=A0A183IF64_9BILA|nr:unnamed protein product [Soboliphyme baturini]